MRELDCVLLLWLNGWAALRAGDFCGDGPCPLFYLWVGSLAVLGVAALVRLAARATAPGGRKGN
jgi:hypothetical protein